MPTTRPILLDELESEVPFFFLFFFFFPFFSSHVLSSLHTSILPHPIKRCLWSSCILFFSFLDEPEPLSMYHPTAEELFASIGVPMEGFLMGPM